MNVNTSHLSTKNQLNFCNYQVRYLHRNYKSYFFLFPKIMSIKTIAVGISYSKNKYPKLYL